MAERVYDKKKSVQLSWLTVEVALYFLIALAAAGLRLYRLGARPMTEGEAAQALAAWRFTQGQAVGPMGYSPLLFTSSVLLFGLFRAGDLTARLVPALFGVAAVILPCLLRRRLGRMGALATSLLLAISPAANFFSRYLGGEIVVAACALALTIGLFGYLDERRPKYLYLAAVALAVALSAGRGAYTLLLALGTFFAGSGEARRSIIEAWQRESHLFIRCLSAAAIVFALVCTCFLLNFSGLQAGADLLPAWLAALKPGAGDHPWHYHLQLLALYEPLVLIFGLAEMFRSSGERDLLRSFLAYWAIVAFLVYAVAGGRGPGDVLLIVVPLALLAGSSAGRLLEGIAHGWAREGLFLALAGAIACRLYLELAGYASGRGAMALYPSLWLALAILLLAVGLVALFWTYFGPATALRGAGLALLVILAVATVGIGCNLNFCRASDPREPMVVSPTSPNIFDLVETLEMVSLQREGEPHAMAVTVHESPRLRGGQSNSSLTAPPHAGRNAGPVLAWYLRRFANVEFVPQLGPAIATPAVIAPAEEKAPSLGGQYVGQDFVLRLRWRPQGLSGPDRVRWLLYRQAPTPVQADRVVLWIKQAP